MGVSGSDNNAAVINFANQNNLSFPLISGVEGNGSDIVSSYGITGHPAYILIAPDRSIVEQSLSISSLSSYATYFANYSILESTCTTGISEAEQEENNLSIYPNPNNGNFNVAYDYVGDVIIQIHNVLGARIYKEEIKANGYFTKALNNSEIKNGIYFVSIKTKDRTLVKKLIID